MTLWQYVNIYTSNDKSKEMRSTVGRFRTYTCRAGIWIRLPRGARGASKTRGLLIYSLLLSLFFFVGNSEVLQKRELVLDTEPWYYTTGVEKNHERAYINVNTTDIVRKASARSRIRRCGEG